MTTEAEKRGDGMETERFAEYFERVWGELRRVFDDTHLGFGKSCYNDGFLAGQQSSKSKLLYWIEGRMHEIGYHESDTGAFVPNAESVEGEFYALIDIEEKIKELIPLPETKEQE